MMPVSRDGPNPYRARQACTGLGAACRTKACHLSWLDRRLPALAAAHAANARQGV
jgi:hypothetical protein